MKNLFLLIPLLMFVACSKNTTSTKLKVSSNFVFGGSTLNGTYTAGGLMVWGQGPGGEAFGRAMVGTDTINVDLKNGAWTFYSIAWEEVTDNFTGKPRCAKFATNLAGEAVAVNLNLTNANCADPVFSNNIHGTTPSISLPPAKVEWCSTSPSAVTAHTDKCTDDTTDINRKAAKGHGTSYRYRMRSFDRKGGATSFLSDEIASYCLDGNSSPTTPLHSGVTSEMPGLPVGVGNTTPFHITMDVYLQTMDCENATSLGDRKGAISIELPHGLQSQQPRLKYVVEPIATGRSKVYVQMSEADMCNGRTIGSASYPFAGGAGTAERPLLICSAPQLLKVPSVSSAMHFKLLTDVNLNPYTKGLPGEGTEPYFGNCLENGSNFFPIGNDTSGCGTGTNFSGSFDGNNHTITGLRIRLEDKSNVGMFGIISVGANAGVRNLKLIKPEISGKNFVGAIAGSNTSTGSFTNIEVIEADIEAREESGTGGEEAGGIFGTISAGTLSNLIVKKSRIRADDKNAGTIAGSISNITANYLFGSGIIEARDSNAGGLAGTIEDSTINLSRFEGFVTSRENIGGIAGESDSTSYNNIYAHAGVHSRKEALDTSFLAGGLFGEIAGTTATHTVNNAYYAGRMNINCTASDTTCLAGEIAGSYSGLFAGDFINVSYVDHGHAGVMSPPGYGTPISQLQAYNGANLSGLGAAFSVVANDLPRLTVEAALHPCRNNNASAVLSTQIASGRGNSEANPILICNPIQLAAISTQLNRFYRLEGVVDGIEVTAPWGSFTGQLNGNGNAILGMEINNTAPAAAAWFTNMNGTIKDVYFLGGNTKSDTGSPGAGSTAFIATTLNGTIDKVHFEDISWSSDKSGGLIANNINATGKLERSHFNLKMNVLGGGYQGGLATNNYGTIDTINFGGEIRAIGTHSFYSLGGLVSENYGKILRVNHELSMFDNVGSTGNYSGLVTQINRSGAFIEDVLIEHARYESSTLTNTIYGMAYSNQGTIRRVFSNADIMITAGAPRAIYHIAGSNSGSITQTIYTRFASVHEPSSTGDISSIPLSSTVCQVSLDNNSYNATGTWLATLGASPTSFLLNLDDKTQILLSTFTDNSPDQFNFINPSACSALTSTVGSLAYTQSEIGGTYIAPDDVTYDDVSSWDGGLDSLGRSVWVADMGDSAQEDRVMSIMLAIVTGQPLPETAPTWEFESGDGLRLFKLE